MDIMLIISGALGVILLIGVLLGLLRSWKKSTIRFGLLLFCFLMAMVLSSKIASLLMSKFVNGLVLTIFGKTIDFESLVGDIAGDLMGEGSAMTDFATALLNIVVKLIAFLVVFIVLMIVTLLVYYIIVAIMSKAEKKKSVGKPKQKWWERLIGAGVGVLGSLLVCMALFTPVFGVMNVCDKFLEDSSSKETASAYVESSYVCGKFYTDDENIGSVETYLEKYDKLRKSYNKSFAGIMFKCTGVDALGKATFNSLSTVKQNGMKVNFTTECVNLVNVYNLYKTNFIEAKFDLSTEESVQAVQDIYNIAKDSEVMRSFIVDLVPKMANKWTNGEKFLGMEIPVSGDAKDIVIDMLEVFNITDFDVIDANMNVMFDAIKVANKHGVIKDINNGEDIMDVLGKDGFVEEELNTLSTTPQMKRALPKIMTTTVKVAYKSVIGDPNPADKLDQEFTQEQIANITWKSEATRMQTIVTTILDIMDEPEILNNLTNIGIVIDSARDSDVISEPVKILVSDYLEQKSGLKTESKQTLLSAINSNWGVRNYSYTSLFATIETTAKVAQSLDNNSFMDMAGDLSNILESANARETIKNAINNGVFDDLIGTDSDASVYKDMISSVLDYSDDENPLNVDDELQAGQVIADIINKSSSSSQMIAGDTEEEKMQNAKEKIDTLTNSKAIMDLLESEAQKTETAGETSKVQEFIKDMNSGDKTAFENAIRGMENTEDQETLAKLFGVKLS